MTRPDPSSVPAAALAAPLHIADVGLVVRDLDGISTFYRRALGLATLGVTDDTVTLGVDGAALVHLTRRRDALPDAPSEAGLYHTAFLMPTRKDLAHWILHAARTQIPISGASDHDVSEAIYLEDPEGNGIEVYSDRPPERWRRDGKTIFQKTDPLDIGAIVAEVDPAASRYPAAPLGLRLGHVHLRVGDMGLAETFYGDLLRLDITRRRAGATFLSSGGYHHHIAANVWHSAGAGERDRRRAGLHWVTLALEDRATLEATARRLGQAGHAIEPHAEGVATADPWGTAIRLQATQAPRR